MATRQVMQVNEVVVIKRPFDIVVVAKGLAETSKWSEPILVGGPISPEGCLELSFEAVPPHGQSVPVTTPIAMSHSQPIPSWRAVRSVKINAAQNAISVSTEDCWQWCESHAES
jgi:hypothetical protein